jgi:thioredoxin reductase (NADPH)
MAAESRKLIIIGSGPSGLTAAIYAARASLKPLVIEGGGSGPQGNLPGGQLMWTTEVENFPGFENGIMGPELMATMRKQAARFETEFLTEDVTKVDFSKRPFKIWVGAKEFLADSVIISTGAKSVMLGLDREDVLIGHGLSTCATCDGFFFTGKEIGVVGGGDAAVEEAMFLTKFATKVNLFVRGNRMRASQIMQDRIKQNDKVEIHWNTEVKELLGDKELEGVNLHNNHTDQMSEFPLQGLFYSIGHKPNTELFVGQVDMLESGYIRTHADVATSVEGVFAAGDVQDHEYRQAITSAGSGCMAAMSAERWLAAQHG